MAFRTILGKLFLTKKDRQTLDADLNVVKRYTKEVLDEERRIEEERKSAEAREAARKAEKERLAAFGKVEEAPLAAGLDEKEEEEVACFSPDVTPEQSIDDTYEKIRAEKRFEKVPMYEIRAPKRKAKRASKEPRFSVPPPKEKDEKRKKSPSDTGNLVVEEHEPADLFGYNSPYGIDDILSNPGISRSMHKNMTFSEKLSQLMEKYRMSSADVYKAGNVDKSLFSKLLSNPNYMPSKDTAIAIALAMKLSLEEAEDLIERAGYTLSHSIVRDIVLECCFKRKIFNVVEVNIILDQLGHKPLSRIPY